LLNVAPKYSNDVAKELRRLGFTCKFGSFSKDLEQYQLIIITTDYDFTEEEIEKLRIFSKNGGAILCCYAPSASNSMTFSINTFLDEFGLSYMNLSLSSDSSSPVKVRMPYSYLEVRNKVFVKMLKPIQDILSNKSIDPEMLDDFVIELRYTMQATSERHIPTISTIFDYCWEFLNKTGYKDEAGKMNPDVVQSIIIILITELNSKLPLAYKSIIPDSVTFPGACIAEKKDYMIELSIKDQTMTSTGLWLPAGDISTILIEEDCGNTSESIVAQIGIHTETLISQNKRWKRWPQVATAYKLTKGETQVYSQFGGIVYIAANDLDCKRKIKFVFKGFVKHPRAIEGMPEEYEQTKDIEVPWAEIHCKKCILTVPTKQFRKINDFTEVYSFINSTVKSISEFCDYPVKRIFRIAFDIQTPGGRPVASYPIFLEYEDMYEILVEHNKPSIALYNLIVTLTTVCLKEDYFDSLTEQSLSQLVAAHIMYKMFNGLDIEKEEMYEKTKLFPDLWLIHRKMDSTIIPKIIHNSNLATQNVFYDEEDKWANFITELSKLANLNFVPAFENIQRIPKNINADVQQYPIYETP
jgi:hypothetical protein